jgi:hypothetical protein
MIERDARSTNAFDDTKVASKGSEFEELCSPPAMENSWFAIRIDELNAEST